jgi:hypothetical protein
VVSHPCEASWEARLTIWICVAPLRLRGLRGKQSTPSDWLGGTGVVYTVGEQEWDEACRQCLEQEKGNGTAFNFPE